MINVVMKKFSLKVLILFICLAFSLSVSYADNMSKADKLLRKAKMTSIQDESYEYVNAARELYEEEYEKNPSDTKVLIGLSKTFQLIGDRAEAKLYVLKAYNMFPSNPDMQKEMGDFHYSFQEYSTAVEYYKLSLASGNLRDFATNLQTAKCFEKLGDLGNAELYYKICYHLDSKSREVLNKLNEYESSHRPDDTQELENAKYKYLFKYKKKSEQELIEEEAKDLIEKLN